MLDIFFSYLDLVDLSETKVHESEKSGLSSLCTFLLKFWDIFSLITTSSYILF